jgi:hypothetical protein
MLRLGSCRRPNSVFVFSVHSRFTLVPIQDSHLFSATVCNGAFSPMLSGHDDRMRARRACFYCLCRGSYHAAFSLSGNGGFDDYPSNGSTHGGTTPLIIVFSSDDRERLSHSAVSYAASENYPKFKDVGYMVTVGADLRRRPSALD